ncbi:hypothetical protein H8D36_01630 [archaeon]|nr:hypothetical protein [archaeon]MBL7056818.1 hypothetical protein [Candidatus Woesearchaeota archaeon]
MKTIEEGKAKIRISEESKISRKLPVFYNPVMKFNRDISILLLNSLPDKDLQIGLPLSGSGIRGIRFLLELKKNKIKNISFNDNKSDFVKILNENFKISNIKKNKDIIISNEDANLFMLNTSGFSYIDIDPFGTPNPFLDAAITRLSREGILAVTATDTSALCGTYENACKRKYWAVPLRNELKHEIGIRILIRKVQLIAAQFDKALTPIFSYSKEHYFRVFFRCKKGKTRVDKVIKKHGMIGKTGPLWFGSLWHKPLVKKMLKNADPKLEKFLGMIMSESEINVVGFHDIHKICEHKKLYVPKYEPLMETIRKRGFQASRTHFSDFGIRSNISLNELVEIIKN